jgi:hypothetical protein
MENQASGCEGVRFVGLSNAKAAKDMSMAARINLPIRPVIPDENIRASTVADIRSWVKTQSEAVHGWALRIGEALIQLRELCHEDGKLWKSQFPVTRAERDLDTKLPFSYSTANKLISVYGNEALRKVSHVLPADWSSLYALSRIPAPKLGQFIQQGKVTSTMSRTEIVRLSKRNPHPTKSKAETNTVAESWK